jgi:predicted solute-binding protein
LNLPAAPDFSTLRIAGLGAMNALPLVHKLPGTILSCTPAEAAAAYEGGRVDLALLPVGAILARDWRGQMLEGLGIAAKGPVFSVFVTWPKSVEKIHRICLDPASRSSVALLRLLQGRFGLLGAGAWQETTHAEAAEARLLIGDHAVNFRRQHQADANFVDLAELWHEQTGLPFVFAAWVLRPESPFSREHLDQFLRDLCRRNLAALPELLADRTDHGFWQEYFSHLHYELAPDDLRAIDLFDRLCREEGIFEKS